MLFRVADDLNEIETFCILNVSFANCDHFNDSFLSLMS